MQTGLTVWFTGLSGSGKTTISREMEKQLRQRGVRKLEVLDGDVVRTNLSKGLGFSKEDRDINIRRIGFVAKLLTRNGVLVMTAAISPYRSLRDEIRMDIGDFLEVYVSCPVKICAERDVKGLYEKAMSGEIKHFTGVSDPYEEPINAEVVCETDKETVEESTAKILHKMEMLGYLPPTGDIEYPPEEEAKIKERLASLGYF